MSKPQKVVWTKGMFLMPQHFQAQDEYFEQALHFRASVSAFANWGFSALGIDEAALVNGLFSLRHCEGIFPDGLSFQIPLNDELPAVRQVDEYFSSVRQAYLDVYLAVPQERPSGRNYSNPGDASASSSFRYIVRNRPATDATLGSDEKVIQVAKKSLRILFEGENLDGFSTCHVARVMRSPAGTYILSPDFVPPVIDIAASAYLMMLTRRQIDIMTAKSAALGLIRSQKSRDRAGFSNSEADEFWFLHTVNSYLPDLNHIWKVRRGHPEPLFRAMLRLAGALTTFAVNESIADLPDYDHSSLGTSFTLLDARIRRLLEIVRQSKYIPVLFRSVERFIWSAALDDERQLDASHFLISVNSSIPVEELISKFPRLAKISTSDELQRLIRSALPGLGLRHQPTPPPSVPINLNCQYFSLSASGPLWENIVRARSMSVFVPSEIADVKMELLTVLA